MRRAGVGFSVVLGVVVALVLLRPVLLAPVTGDDVYYSLAASSDPDRTVLTEMVDLPREWSDRVLRGRVNVLTAVERRTSGRMMLDTAVATGRPAHHVLGVLRIAYAALSLVAVYALLRSIRWRRRDTGGLVRLDGRTRNLAMVAGGLAFAAGAQPQLVGNDGWNGWVAYPVLTWTAAASVFGIVALALWTARLVSAHGRAYGVPAALLFLFIGALTNFRSELTFPAVPLTIIALLVVPVSDRQDRARGRRAKWLVGSAYVAGFVPLLVVIRMMLRDVCERGDCYDGVSLSLRPAIFPTFARNVISSVPGTGREEILELLRTESVAAGGAWVPTPWSALTALALLAVLALAWFSGRPHVAAGPSAGAEEERSQTILCLVSAGMLGLGGLGAAAVMSLSQKAQGKMSDVGILSRHSVVTWIGVAFALVLVVLAAGVFRDRWGAPSFVALALAMALLVATKMPVDGKIMVANASRMAPTMHVFGQVVGDGTSDLANRRRCRILREVDRELSGFDARNVRRSSQRAFERYWHIPFCVRS